jgi:hypothetical protein
MARPHADLAELKAVDLTLDGQRYRLRTDLQGSAFAAFAAAGVRLPPVLTHHGGASAAQSEPATEAVAL